VITSRVVILWHSTRYNSVLSTLLQLLQTPLLFGLEYFVFCATVGEQIRTLSSCGLQLGFFGLMKYSYFLFRTELYPSLSTGVVMLPQF
jgi:hypothetical protein